MEEVKKKRSVMKAGFTRTEGSLRRLLGDEESLVETIKRKFGELGERWRELQETHDTYMTMVEDESFDKENEWVDDLLSRFEDIESCTDKALRKRSNIENPTVKVESSATNSQNEPPIEKSRLQLEKLKLDKFDGDLRKYPGFKERFKLYIEPMVPKAQVAFVLRSHLEPAVREDVENIEDDMSLLWQRLDAKYGNLRRYIDSVLLDLSKTTKGDGKAALDMINTVEKAHIDLQRIGAQAEMSNSYIIALIEKKLPEEMRMDWVKFIAEKGEVDSNAIFKLLMGFLKKWRQIIEYDAAAIRKVPEKKSGTTHHANVKQNGHTKSEVCWVHEDGYHPVWKCKIFQMMPMNEKLNLVKSKKACHACLETSCQGATDPEKCRKEFKCPISGCNKPHNILLHQ